MGDSAARMALVSASRINLSFFMIHLQRWEWFAGIWCALSSSGGTTSRAAAAWANHPDAGSTDSGSGHRADRAVLAPRPAHKTARARRMRERKRLLATTGLPAPTNDSG